MTDRDQSPPGSKAGPRSRVRTQGISATSSKRGISPSSESPSLQQQQQQQESPRDPSPTGGRKKLNIQRPVVPTELTSQLSARLAEAEKLQSRRGRGHQHQQHQHQQQPQGGYECMVCLSAVLRADDVWCCKSCWAIFHVDCIAKWAESQTSKSDLPDSSDFAALGRAQDPISAALWRHREAAMAREREAAAAATGGAKAWRCPGCRGLHTEKPKAGCFCGKFARPPAAAGAGFADPHSCGELCGRMREGTSCPHPCTLRCHPGPCPPCASLGAPRHCFCGRREYRLRCGEEDGGSSCGETCDRALACGSHRCSAPCHAGDCPPCGNTVGQTCYCGAATEQRPCGSGERWDFGGVARFFGCGGECPRMLACGAHKCPKKCHSGECPQCELLPSRVLTCPCGKAAVGTLVPGGRKSCADAVPTCGQRCGRRLACGHGCVELCHPGGCPPCRHEVDAQCRCGSETRRLPCCEAVPGSVLCNRICRQKKNCRRHACGERCCPSMRRPSDPEGRHICALPCGAQLSCGRHACDLLCHPGPCPPCAHMLLDPLVCRCGAAVIAPPIPCGMPPPECMKPCSVARACGHSESPAFRHRCHFGDCPPCVALVERMCAGGHELWKNVQCHRTVVCCGKPCGKGPLPCGQHNCRVTCHAGPCPDFQPPTGFAAQRYGTSCGQRCAKTRAGCGHACVKQCQHDGRCEDEPCREKVTLRCACGRRSIQADCLSLGAPVPPDAKPREIECDDECTLVLRNRRLAQAFGIRPEGAEAPSYGDFLVQFAAGRRDFVRALERQLAEFIQGDSKTLQLKSMDAPQRQFVHGLAKYYGLVGVSEGPESSRCVVLNKTLDAALPSVPVSAVAADPSIPVSLSQVPAAAQDEKDKSFVLRLSDNVSLDGSTINQILRPFGPHVQLVWLDRKNALAVFQDEPTMRAARSALIPLQIVVGGF